MTRARTDNRGDSGLELEGDDAGDQENPPPQPTDATGRLLEFFESMGGAGGAATVEIYQVDPANQSRKSWLFAFPAGELTPTELMQSTDERYGPGLYEATGRGPKGRILFRQTFQVGAVRPRVSFNPPASERPPPPAIARQREPGAGGDLAAVLERQSALLEALVAKLSTPAAAPPAGERDLLGTIKELAAVKSFFVGSDSESTMGSALQIVREALRLRDEITETEAPADPMTSAFKALMPMLTEAMQMQKRNPTMQELRALGPPASDKQPTAAGAPGARPAGADPTAAAGGSGQLEGYLRMALPQLLMAARLDADQERVADMLLERLQAAPALLAALPDWLNDDAAADKLIALEPAVAEQREWFDGLIDTLLERLIPAPAGEGRAAEVDFSGGEGLPLTPGVATIGPETATGGPVEGDSASTRTPHSDQLRAGRNAMGR